MSLASAIFYQDTVRQILFNSSQKKSMHHAFLFQGEEGVGKFSSALFFTKLLFCQIPNSSPCGKCSSCLSILKYKFSSLFVLSNDDRIPYIRFYQQNISAGKKYFIPSFYSEIYLLLYRYNSKFLSILEKEKKRDFPEGIVTNETKMLENSLNIQEELKECVKKKDFFSLLQESFTNKCILLQNGLDRSVWKKENVFKLFSHLQVQQNKRQVIIINDISKMNSNLVGAFLKLLEEPPLNTTFLLISKHWKSIDNKVTLPLFSRCISLKFNSFKKEQIKEILLKKYKIFLTEIEQQQIANNFKETLENLISKENSKQIVAEILRKKINGKSISFSQAISYLEKNNLSPEVFFKQAKSLLKKQTEQGQSKFYLKFRLLEKMIYDAEKNIVGKKMKKENILYEFIIRLYTIY